MAAVDDFGSQKPGLSSPIEDGAAVTPSDDDELAKVSRFLWVGGAGAVKVTTVKGTALTFTGVAAGTLLPVRAKKVFATGTTATLIVAAW